MLYDSLSEDSNSNSSSSSSSNMYQEEDSIQTTSDYTFDVSEDNRLLDNGCLKLDDASKQFLAEFNFWVEGVLQTALAFLGNKNILSYKVICKC